MIFKENRSDTKLLEKDTTDSQCVELDLLNDEPASESDSEAEASDPTPAELVTEPSTPIVRRSARKKNFPDYFGWSANVVKVEPRNVKEEEKDNLLEAMQKEMESLEKNDVWEPTELPEGRQPDGSKWVFKTKMDANGKIERGQARLDPLRGQLLRAGLDSGRSSGRRAGGREVRNPLGRQPTPIPEGGGGQAEQRELPLRGERAGGHHGLRRRVRGRLHLRRHHRTQTGLRQAADAVNRLQLHQVDITTVFLNGQLEEEGYMVQPEGFVSAGREHLVCRLKNGIYGLKQSPRCWNTTLDSHLKELGFVQLGSDPCIYRSSGGDLCLLGVYVDDIALASRSTARLTEMKIDTVPRAITIHEDNQSTISYEQLSGSE